MSTSVLLNPTITSYQNFGSGGGYGTTLVGESTGPTAGSAFSSAVGGFTQAHYAQSVPQVTFTGVAAGDYFFCSANPGGNTGSLIITGFNWPQTFTASGGSPPSAVISSTTATTIVCTGTISTSFPTSGTVVVAQGGTTYTFAYTSYTGATFTITANSTVLGIAGSGIAATTMSAGSALSLYYTPIALNAIPTLGNLPTASNPALNGFPTSGYVQVVHTPSNSAASLYYVYSYTGIGSGGFTGVVQTSLGSGSLPVTSMASADVVLPFYAPVATYITSIQVVVRIGQSNTYGYLQIGLKSASLGINQYTQLSEAQLAGMTTSTPGVTGVISTAPIILSTPILATAANLADISVNLGYYLGQSVSGEARIPSCQLLITTTQSYPNTTLSLPQSTLTSSGVAALQTRQPTVSWSYSDTDNLAQYSYRILIFKQSVATNGSFTLNPPPAGVSTTGAVSTTAYGGTAKSLWPVYDSGDVVSSATSATVNPSVNPQYGPGPLYYPQLGGPLQVGTTYRVFLFVTAVDELGTYQTITNSGTMTGDTAALNSGGDFISLVEPVLMPSLQFPSTPGTPAFSFNGATGAIGTIAVRQRLNLLSSPDSDFLTVGSANVQSKGGWALDTNFASTGTGTAPTITTQAPSNALVPAALAITPYATSTTIVNVISEGTSAASAPCTGGEMITATVKVRDLRAFGSVNTSVTPYLTFWNASGVLQTVIAENYVLVGVNASTVSIPTLAWIQCKSPYGATGVSLGVSIKCTLGAISQAPNWEISQPCITVNSINVLDDAAIGSGLVSVVAFGATSFTGGAMTNSGWVVEGTTPYTSIANSAVMDNGPSFPNGIWGIPMPTTTANRTAAHTACTIGSLTTDTNPWMMACDALTVASDSPATITPGTVNAVMGAISYDGTVAAQATVALAITSTYTRFTGVLTPSVNQIGVFGVGFAATPGVTNEGVDISNLQLERIWTFVDGTFEAFTSGTNLPLATALGVYGSGTTAAQPGQWWTNASQGSGVTAAISNVSPQSGTNCLQITTSGPTVGVVEQFFTVSGRTTLTISWYWKWTALTQCQGYVEFFDSAGTKLSVVSTPQTVTSQTALITGTGTQAAYVQATPTAVSIPSGAAYAHFVVTVQATLGASTTLSLDTVVLSLTGGSVLPSLQWLDGGWSQGGLQQAGNLGVTLQGSADDVNWTTKRIAPNAAVAATVAGPSFEADYTDYEYPAGPYATADEIWYQAFSGPAGNINESPVNSVAISATVGFAPANWMLIDPLYPTTNIVLQVKGDVSFTTDENQTILMPMNRGKKVVLGDTYIFGDTIDINCQTLTNADFAALQVMYSKTYPLVLRSPDGEMWYVRGTKRSRKRTWQGSYTRPYRTYQLSFETVDNIA